MFNFNNIGEKIKGLAIAYFIISTIAQIIYGIYLWFEFASGLGFLLIIASPFLAWISSWTLYGFGQLVENSQKSAEMQEEILQELESERRKAAELESLRILFEEEKLITEEEYKKKYKQIIRNS